MIRKVLMMSVVLVTITAALSAETAKKLDAIADAVGVNTHFGATNTNYGVNASTTISLMRQMGLRHYRDGLLYLSGQKFPSSSYAAFQTLGQSGINGDYIYDCGAGSSAEAGLLALTGNVDGIEYPNEWDNSGDKHWAATLKACGKQIETVLPSFPAATFVGPSLVYMNSPTTLGPTPMGINNLHAYVNNYAPDLNYSSGANPGPNAGGGPCLQLWKGGSWTCFPGLRWQLYNMQTDAPGLSAWVTETGYETSGSPSTPGNSQFVPEKYEPAYFVREILWALDFGVPRVYFYELLDEGGSTFGMVDGKMNPKPGFYALSNLIGLTSDKVAFTPGTLNYTSSGGNGFYRHELFQKSDGTFYLAMWLSASDWDGAKNIAVPPQWVTVNISGHNVVSTEQLQEDGTFSSATVNKSSYTQRVTTSPVFLEIK